jgi:hypothetical protein
VVTARVRRFLGHDGAVIEDVDALDRAIGLAWRAHQGQRFKLKALIAIARSILVIVWHLLADPHGATPTSDATSSTTDYAPIGAPKTTSTNSRPSATKSPSNRPPHELPAQPSGHFPIRKRSILATTLVLS